MTCISAKRFLKDARGAAALELAVIGPLLVLSAIVLTDLGLPIYRKMQAQSAAQAGAHFASTHGFDSSAISAVVANATQFSSVTASPEPVQFCGCSSGAGVTATLCTATCSSGDTAGVYVQVSASAPAPRLMPFAGVSTSTTVTGHATIRIK
jgi:Flp pilus assembly protein TadG